MNANMRAYLSCGCMRQMYITKKTTNAVDVAGIYSKNVWCIVSWYVHAAHSQHFLPEHLLQLLAGSRAFCCFRWPEFSCCSCVLFQIHDDHVKEAHKHTHKHTMFTLALRSENDVIQLQATTCGFVVDIWQQEQFLRFCIICRHSVNIREVNYSWTSMYFLLLRSFYFSMIIKTYSCSTTRIAYWEHVDIIESLLRTHCSVSVTWLDILKTE